MKAILNVVGKDVVNFQNDIIQQLQENKLLCATNDSMILKSDEIVIRRLLQSCKNNAKHKRKTGNEIENIANQCIQYIIGRQKFWSETSDLNCSLMHNNQSDLEIK